MAKIRDLALGRVLTAPSPATTGTTLVLEAGQGQDMPTTVPFKLLAYPEGYLPTKSNSEKILVTARTDDTLTIVRAQGETTAKNIAAGWLVSNNIFTDDIEGYQAPVGGVIPYAGTTAPDGWLMCYGQDVSRTVYADLFTAIGTTYGSGDGTATFTLPDLRGRVIAGQDDMGGTSANRLTGQTGGVDGDVMGATGGAEIHVLSTTEMPSHNHLVQMKAKEYVAGTARYPWMVTFDASAFDWGGTKYSENTGGGMGHNNVQPTILMNYIIKASAPVDPTVTLTAAQLMSTLYPIGSIYENADVSTNPATLLGFGTWAAFGAGRVTVAVNASDTEFDTLGETGGAKTHTLTVAEMPSHTHGVGTLNRVGNPGVLDSNATNLDDFPGSNGPLKATNQVIGTAWTGSLDNTGGGGAHNNLQPYITIYRWKRTA